LPRPKRIQPQARRRHPSYQRKDAGSTEVRREMRKLAREVQDAANENYDGWHNAITRLGERMHDKRLAGRHLADRIVDLEAEDIWRGDPMAARVVEDVPNQILRAGVEVQVQQSEGTKEQDRRDRQRKDRLRWMRSTEGKRWWSKRVDALVGDPLLRQKLKEKIREDLAAEVFPETSGAELAQESKEIQEANQEFWDDMSVLETFCDALKAESGYGGAALFPIIRDGEKDLSKPLDHDRIESIDGLDLLTPIELIPFQWYADPTDLYYGRPQLYWMQRISIGNIGATARVPIHESRLITFPGVVVSRRQLREHWGWGDSVLVRMKETLRDFAASHQGAAILMQEFAQAYMKIKGLADSFGSSESDLLAKRATAFQEGISIARIGIIDAEEEYGRITTPVSGLPDLLDRMAHWLAASADVPVTRLMGQAPAGLNATGKADERSWYDSIDRFRRQKLERRMRKFQMMLWHSKEGPTGGSVPDKWSFKFGHLWQPTDKEQAEARYLVAQADNIYISAGVLIPEEVAKSHFGGDEYSAEIQLDADIRDTHDEKVQEEAEQEAEMQQAKIKSMLQPKVVQAPPGNNPTAGNNGAPKPKSDASADDDEGDEGDEDDDDDIAAEGTAAGPKQARPSPSGVPGEGGSRGKRGRKRGQKSGAEEVAEANKRKTAGENEMPSGIPTTGTYRKGAGGTKPPPQPPTEARYPTPKDTAYKIPGPEVPVGKLQGPQSI